MPSKGFLDFRHSHGKWLPVALSYINLITQKLHHTETKCDFSAFLPLSFSTSHSSRQEGAAESDDLGFSIFIEAVFH